MNIDKSHENIMLKLQSMADDITGLQGQEIMLRMRIENLEKILERKLAMPTGKAQILKGFKFDKLISYTRTAKKYIDDKKFSGLLSLGYMPRAKLLKLLKQPVAAFDDDLNAAIAANVLKEVMVYDNRSKKYTRCVIPREMQVMEKEMHPLDETALPWLVNDPLPIVEVN